MGNKKVSVEELEVWFSEPRLHRYRMYRNPEQVYHWNAHITKELLVDIGHLEILLRNAVDRALRQDDRYGKYWFQNPALPLSYQAQKSVVKRSNAQRGAGQGLWTPVGLSQNYLLISGGIYSRSTTKQRSGQSLLAACQPRSAESNLSAISTLFISTVIVSLTMNLSSREATRMISHMFRVYWLLSIF